MIALAAIFLLAAVRPHPSPDCVPDQAVQSWIQRSLAGWEFASDSLLRLEPASLPWIVLFDERCAWHLAPDPARLVGATRLEASIRFRDREVPIYGIAHGGFVKTPAGDSFPVSPRVYAALADSLHRPYFVAALPAVFRADPRAAADSLLDDRMASVLSHEIVHTRQLPSLRRALAELRQRYRIPTSANDDIVEREFGDSAEFRTAFEQERDLLYRAAFAPDPAAARRDAGRAVALIRARRARFFVGPYAGWDRLEDVFLALEGVGEWVRFALHRRNRNRWPDDRDIVEFIRGRNGDWVQDEGLALYLVIDRLASGWQGSLMEATPRSPVDLLAGALDR